MIGRRGFLRAASIGLVAPGLIANPLRSQDPKAKARNKAKAKASPSPTLEIDEQVNRILDQARTDGRRLPGIIGGIIKGEELTNVGAVGLRKIGSPEPIRVSDPVHLGSNTKAMTATMVGTVVDEGLLRWESTVRDIFPDWSGQIHPDYANVTLRQMMSHRGGFPHDLRWFEAGDGRSLFEMRRALMSRALQEPPEVRPGSKYSYSNTGFVLAGMMAEEVTQTPWEILMARRMFGPLKMASAGYGAPGNPGRVDHAWGHLAQGDTVRAIHLDNPAMMAPAGTVHCTIQDWARFAAYHLKGSLGGLELLKPATLEALHTPRPGEDYAGGWFVGGRARDELSHNGSNNMWYASIRLIRSKQVGALVITNAGGKPAEDACAQAIRELIRYALPAGEGNGPRRR